MENTESLKAPLIATDIIFGTKKHKCRSQNNILVEKLPPSFHRLYHPSVYNRFTAYIVIPMWPEGDPTSVPMQVHNMHLLNNDMHIFIGQSQHLVKLLHFPFLFYQTLTSRQSSTGNIVLWR